MLEPTSTRTQTIRTFTWLGIAVALLSACNSSESSPPLDAGTDAAEPEPDAEVDAAAPEPDAGCEADEDSGAAACCEEQVLDDVFNPVVLPAGTCWRVNELLSGGRVDITVERGVRIAFAPGAGLNAHSGSIAMNGTADEPILLTSIEPEGEWRGMHFSESTDTVPGTYALEHVIFERGGESVGNGGLDNVEQHRAALLMTGSSDVVLDAVTFRGTPSYGLLVRDPQVVLTARGTRFVHNHVAALLPVYRLDALDAATTFEDNEDPRIHVGRPVDSGFTGGARNVVVSPIAPYYMTSAERVDAMLTLEPGTHFELARHAGLHFGNGGSLVAEGTAEEPIELIGATDERGFWRGLYFAGRSVSLSLSHVTLANAGSEPWTGNEESLGGLFLFEQQLDVAIDNCTFRSHGGAAFSPVKIAKSLNWSITATEFRDNELPALLTTEQVSAFGAGITFADNDVDALVVGRTDDVRPGVLEDATDWAALSLRFDDELIVRAPLTIAAGATLRFGEDIGMTVEDGGELVLGGPETQTVLTSYGDGASAWRGVSIDGGTGHSIEYTLIERGGSSGSADVAANLHVFGGASVTLNRIDLVDGEGHGLSVHTDSTFVTCAGLIFEGNAGETLHSYGGGAAPVCP